MNRATPADKPTLPMLPMTSACPLPRQSRGIGPSTTALNGAPAADLSLRSAAASREDWIAGLLHLIRTTDHLRLDTTDWEVTVAAPVAVPHRLHRPQGRSTHPIASLRAAAGTPVPAGSQGSAPRPLSPRSGETPRPRTAEPRARNTAGTGRPSPPSPTPTITEKS